MCRSLHLSFDITLSNVPTFCGFLRIFEFYCVAQSYRYHGVGPFGRVSRTKLGCKKTSFLVPEYKLTVYSTLYL
jgi:hypothetical protein